MKGGGSQAFVKFLQKNTITLDLPDAGTITPQEIIKKTLIKHGIDKNEHSFRIFRGTHKNTTKEIHDFTSPLPTNKEMNFFIDLKEASPVRDEEGYAQLKRIFRGFQDGRIILDSAACTSSIEKNIPQQFMFRYWNPKTIMIDGLFYKEASASNSQFDFYKYIHFEEIPTKLSRLRIFRKKAGDPIVIELTNYTNIPLKNKEEYHKKLREEAASYRVDLEKEEILYYLVQYNHRHTSVESILQEVGSSLPLYLWTGVPQPY